MIPQYTVTYFRYISKGTIRKGESTIRAGQKF